MQNSQRITQFVILLVTLNLLWTATAVAEDAVAPQEAELLAVLRSDAPAADKAITCKKLAIYGSAEAVPDLAKLLADPELNSWARIALEAIPGEEADEALRNATESLDGLLLVGTINSIGVRQDAQAVEILSAHLQDADSDVASAAAVALGHVGNASASESLRQALATASLSVRSSIAEGCVLCAESFLADGDSDTARQIYDEVRAADVPLQRVIEATRGAILARKEDEAIPLLMEQFRSPVKQLFQLALGTAREFPGGDVDQALANEMRRTSPERAALIIQAMADRPETVVLTAVLDAAGQGPKEVRLSAIEALKRIGDVSCLPSLLEIALETDEDVAGTAKDTLSEIPGDDVDGQILALLPQSEGGMYPLMVELVGRRRLQAVPELIKALESSDNDVRSAALIALGETVDLDRLDVLVNQVVSPDHSDDAPVAQRALKAASVRMPDREACAVMLADAIDQTPSVKTMSALLEILAAVGGTRSLEAVGAAASSADAQLQDTGTRLLGQWMTADAAPVLLDLSKSASDGKYRDRAFRGYLRIARQFVLPEQERVDMCEQAFEMSRRPADQKLVLEVLERYPNAGMLGLAIQAMQTPELKDDATPVVLKIAEKIGGDQKQIIEQLSKAGLEKVKLEIVQAEYGAGTTQKNVTDILQEQVRDFPLITLKSNSYNTSFGGDPAPGVVKELKVRYRIDGKEGEASFAENAPIFLPLPK
ncbi:MAG: hypothetical protein R3B91_00180 [Planctomycetaceae bacterium]